MKPGLERHLQVDRLILVARGGNGGNGALTYLKHVSQKAMGPGIPNGGYGGRGGDVILRASGRGDLRHLKNHVNGFDGEVGNKRNTTGVKGRCTYVDCPPGVVVSEWVGWSPHTKTTQAAPGDLAFRTDLVADGEEYVLASGGSGGRGNTMLHPHTAEDGKIGERRRFLLELKSIADVGLIGFPNAGKSSFLRCVSRATPEVAPYPFTTLNPHVGVCRFKDSSEMTVADVPGLIENAHLNEGLGHEFLRHLERTKMLLYVLDMEKSENPVADFEVLRKEVVMYSEAMARRPFCILANKCDLGERAIRNCDKLTLYLNEVLKDDPLGLEVNDVLHAVSTSQKVGIAKALQGIRKVFLRNNERLKIIKQAEADAAFMSGSAAKSRSYDSQTGSLIDAPARAGEDVDAQRNARQSKTSEEAVFNMFAHKMRGPAPLTNKEQRAKRIAREVAAVAEEI